MNPLRNRATVYFFACFLVVSSSLQAEDGRLAKFFSYIMKSCPAVYKTDEKGVTQIDPKGVVVVTALVLATAKLIEMMDGPVDYLKSCCPVTKWKDDYNRKQEEKELDKILAENKLAEKRAKVMKLQNS